MLDEYYTIIASDINKNKYYASNTEPLLWTNDIIYAKPFNSISSAKTELDSDLKTIKYLVKYYDIIHFYISKIEGNKEVERSEYTWK